VAFILCYLTIQKGADIQQAFKEFNEQGLAAEAGKHLSGHSVPVGRVWKQGTGIGVFKFK
jgi:hypothetical protein